VPPHTSLLPARSLASARQSSGSAHPATAASPAVAGWPRGLIPGDEDWVPRYNIAPAQPVPVIRHNPNEPRRDLSLVRWGLIPSWAKDSSSAARMINTRLETAATKPAFRDALRFRRCIIPADGFYESQRAGKTKQPYCFEVNGVELFAFAEIWERWKDPSGAMLETRSILTTTPNAVTAAIHDRMPVILCPLRELVDLVGIEPTTSSMPWKRAPSCATGPRSGSPNSRDRGKC
jgi:putative SOS response-associated peptidase YedK